MQRRALSVAIGKPPAAGQFYAMGDTKLYVNTSEDKIQVKELQGKWNKTTKSWYAPPGANLTLFTKWLQPPTRVYLDVPFKEKDEAKTLGARFEVGLKKWYFIKGEQNAKEFARWPIVDAITTTVYLDVPYKDKDAAKALGARFDFTAKKWFAKQSDLHLFSKWPRAIQPTAATTTITTKTFLIVPFTESKQVKALGAMYSRQEKRWYVDSAAAPLDKFSKWLPKTDAARRIDGLGLQEIIAFVFKA